MRIGIIGSGFIGRAVAQSATAAGHEAMLSDSRGPQPMSSVLSGIAGSKVGTVEEVIDFGGVVLVAIPFKYYSSLPAMYLKGKIVLDANNYPPNATVALPLSTDSKPPRVAGWPSICAIPEWSRYSMQS
jgi:predicted dinucleotide-binding enzyme